MHTFNLSKVAGMRRSSWHEMTRAKTNINNNHDNTSAENELLIVASIIVERASKLCINNFSRQTGITKLISHVNSLLNNDYFLRSNTPYNDIRNTIKKIEKQLVFFSMTLLILMALLEMVQLKVIGHNTCQQICSSVQIYTDQQID